MKSKKKMAIVIMFTLLLVLMCVSFIKFNTYNFISLGSKISKILSSKTTVEQLSNNPRTYISSPNNSMELLKEFMKKQGYEYLPDERISSTLVFKNGKRKKYIEFHLNKYYSMWIFDQD